MFSDRLPHRIFGAGDDASAESGSGRRHPRNRQAPPQCQHALDQQREADEIRESLVVGIGGQTVGLHALFAEYI